MKIKQLQINNHCLRLFTIVYTLKTKYQLWKIMQTPYQAYTAYYPQYSLLLRCAHTFLSLFKIEKVTLKTQNLKRMEIQEFIKETRGPKLEKKQVKMVGRLIGVFGGIEIDGTPKLLKIELSEDLKTLNATYSKGHKMTIRSRYLLNLANLDLSLLEKVN